MKLPDWIPQTPRPFTKEWAETWDAMTKSERQLSFLADVTVCAVFIGLFYIISHN